MFSLAGCQGGVLDPKGQVGVDEKTLIIVSTLLMLLVVIPVIVMTLYFAWKYREGRDHEIYAPKWAHSGRIETIVWLVPVAIIVVLGGITWYSTHALDPYKPLDHDREPLTVQVVSLNWKWLFIYPEQKIATVNELVFPSGAPLSLKITSDTVMNSFFIPALGGQIYAMAGMQTRLHLLADAPGRFLGRNTQYSGDGFSDQQFTAIAASQADFDAWVAQVRQSPIQLDGAAYRDLAAPSIKHPVTHYSTVEPNLFGKIIGKYCKNLCGADSASTK